MQLGHCEKAGGWAQVMLNALAAFKDNEKSVKRFNERLMCLDCHFQMILPFAVQNGGEGIERECGAAIPVAK